MQTPPKFMKLYLTPGFENGILRIVSAIVQAIEEDASTVKMSNIQMEQLSIAYVSAIAADANWKVGKYNIDTGSVDGLLEPASRKTYGTFKFQLKSTGRGIVKEKVIIYDLDVDNYNDLCWADDSFPHILIFMLMPENSTDRVYQTTEELRLRHCCYWESFADKEESSNCKTVRVEIPKVNVFNSDYLKGREKRN